MPECSVPDTRSVAVVFSYGYQVCCCCALSRIPGLLPPCSVSDSRFACCVSFMLDIRLSPGVLGPGYQVCCCCVQLRITGLLLFCSVPDTRSVAVVFSSGYQVYYCCIQFRIPGLSLLFSAPDTRSVAVVFSFGYQVSCGFSFLLDIRLYPGVLCPGYQACYCFVQIRKPGSRAVSFSVLPRY